MTREQASERRPRRRNAQQGEERLAGRLEQRIITSELGLDLALIASCIDGSEADARLLAVVVVVVVVWRGRDNRTWAWTWLTVVLHRAGCEID
jgi:hypothetical protein